LGENVHVTKKSSSALRLRDLTQNLFYSLGFENRDEDLVEKLQYLIFPRRDPVRIRDILSLRVNSRTAESFVDQGIIPVDRPFWDALPFCDIFTCLTPDLLHQFHRGVFKDHLLQWCQKLLGTREIDSRFMVTPSHPSLRHFNHGISTLAQTNGKDHKNMERVFPGLVLGTDPGVVRAATALIDFINLASFPAHTEATLEQMDDALARFHDDKQVFLDHAVREGGHFDLNKLHSLMHYSEAVRSHGALDGYNTEWSERLHIDFVKKAAEASNFGEEAPAHMVKWLHRRAKISLFRSYLAWAIPEPVTDRDVHRRQGVLAATTPTTSYFVAKKSPMPSTPAKTLQDHFGCARLLPALSEYLTSHDVEHHLSENDRFPVYPRLYLRQAVTPFPSSLSAPLPDECIRAGPTLAKDAAAEDLEPAFDTILAFRHGRPVPGSAHQEPHEGK
jgi:hypothetical protein